MKVMNIMKSMFAAVAVLGLAACADTDAQYEIPVVGAPELVGVTPGENEAIIYGEKTITVTFDRNIGFATKNASQITLNGKPVKNALVLGASNTLTITADVDFSKDQKLVIPAGLILGPQGDPFAEQIERSWTISPATGDAAAMTEKLGWGWNLGNHFDTSDMTWGYWDGSTPSAALFNSLAAAGAKTVRIPTTWTCHMDENHVISADYLNEVAQAVDYAIAAGLNVILNTHHDSFETHLDQAAADASVARADSALIATLWTQVAKKFADYGDNLIFETFNEVHGGDDWSTGSDSQFALLNLWNQYAVDAIRKTGGKNSTRWIGVSGYAANIDLTIEHLVLPKDDANRIMVGVHCYDPYAFCLHPMDEKKDTVQVNSWGHNADPKYSISGANEEYVMNQLYKLRTNFIEKGIPCYLGEYGCVLHTTEKANAFRKYYLEFFCRCANRAGVPMLIWDNNVTTPGNEASGYINHNNGNFYGDAGEVVPMMVKACTSSDESYSFDTIWSHSPAAE